MVPGGAAEFNDKQGDLPVNWAGGRNAKLDNVLWDIVLALSQGGCVVVHCNQSFHRGPLGLMAVLRKLLGRALVQGWDCERG